VVDDRHVLRPERLVLLYVDDLLLEQLSGDERRRAAPDAPAATKQRARARTLEALRGAIEADDADLLGPT
jgi:hypothetical protein